MKLVLTLPKRLCMDNGFRKLAGVELCLRIILPQKMALMENPLAISGATLLSIRQSKEDSVLTVRLKLKNHSVVKIDFHLRLY